MPYTYSDVDNLEGKPLIGSHQCVALLQHYVSARPTSAWREGKKILANPSIAKGTAIATFVNGKYPNKISGNHAALYLSQDAGGIWIMDQWAGKEYISKRYIRKKGANKDGTFVGPQQ
jgi:hypothetical protein